MTGKDHRVGHVIVVNHLPYVLVRVREDGCERWDGGPIGGTVWRRARTHRERRGEFRAGNLGPGFAMFTEAAAYMQGNRRDAYEQAKQFVAEYEAAQHAGLKAAAAAARALFFGWKGPPE